MWVSHPWGICLKTKIKNYRHANHIFLNYEIENEIILPINESNKTHDTFLFDIIIVQNSKWLPWNLRH